jgi:hypothetical protein
MDLPRNNRVNKAVEALSAKQSGIEPNVQSVEDRYSAATLRFFTIMKWAGERSVTEQDQEQGGVSFKDRSTKWVLDGTINGSSVQFYLSHYADNYSDEGAADVFGDESRSWGVILDQEQDELGDVDPNGAIGLFGDEIIPLRESSGNFDDRVKDFEEFVSGFEDDLLSNLGYEQQGPQQS